MKQRRAWRARRATLSLATLLLAGCAMRSDVQRLERQLATQQADAARRDSLAGSQLAALHRLLVSMQDSQTAQSQVITRFRADVRGELLGMQQQLVAVQELTGQSQQRLTEIRQDLAQRAAQAAADTGAGRTPAGNVTPGGESPEQLLDVSIQQLRRGSPGAARAGLAEFLRLYPAHARAVDALYFTGEAWSADQRADSASAVYREVIRRYPQSPRSASSHYRLGMIALAAGRNAEARQSLERVVTQFPQSEEAALARERLRTLPATRP